MQSPVVLLIIIYTLSDAEKKTVEFCCGNHTITRNVTEYVNSDGSSMQSQPKITTDSIRKHLFDGPYFNPNDAVFGWRPVYNQQGKDITEGGRDRWIVHAIVVPPEDDRNKPVHVADPRLPILVDNRIAFFWDLKWLPKANATDCIVLSTANEKGDISFCDVASKKRCKKDATPALNRGPQPGFSWFGNAPDRIQTVFLLDRTRVRELAWLCPNNARCCEWECCIDRLVEEEEGWMETLFKNKFVVVLLLTVIGILICLVPAIIWTHVICKNKMVTPNFLHFLISAMLFFFAMCSAQSDGMGEENGHWEALSEAGNITEYVDSEGSAKHNQSQITTESIKKMLFVGKFEEPNLVIFDLTNRVREIRYGESYDGQQAKLGFTLLTTSEKFMLNFKIWLCFFYDIKYFSTNPANRLQRPPRIRKPAEAYVRNQSLPFLVDTRIAYFFGFDSLPNWNITDCITLPTSNWRGNVTFCDVEFRLRCSRNATPVFQQEIGEFSRSILPFELHYTIRDIRFTDETPVTELAWFCPNDSRCCEWECCVDRVMEEELIIPEGKEKQVKKEVNEETVVFKDMGETLFAVLLLVIIALIFCLVPILVLAFIDRKRRSSDAETILYYNGDLIFIPCTSDSTK